MKPFVAATKNTGLSHVIFVSNGLCKYRLLFQKEFHSNAFGILYSLLKLIPLKMLILHYFKAKLSLEDLYPIYIWASAA